MDPAAGLRDIHLPEPVGWWPPAPGWWIIAALLVAAGLALLWLVRRYRRLSVRQLALKELQRIEHDCHQHADHVRFMEAISALLRRVALSVEPRSVAAGLAGRQWLEHLDELAGAPCFNNDLGQQLIHAAYQPEPDIDTDALLEASRHWIEQVGNRHA